jgi:cysteinyl-tRNA synthetase
VRNFTDIADKIIKRSHAENVPGRKWARRTFALSKDMDALGSSGRTTNPRATEHIADMKPRGRPSNKGHAYNTGGDVYFSVDSFRN